MGVVSYVFNVWCSVVLVSPQKPQCSVCLVHDEVNVSVEIVEIASEVYSRVFVECCGCQLLVVLGVIVYVIR